jgi:hypothetical protein
MDSGARTPEELDMLLEDAFVVGDPAGFGTLFDDGAVLASEGAREARGGEAIGRAAAELWTAGRTYVGGLGRVLQARGTALLVSPAGTHVARRSPDGTWRVAISLLHLPIPPEREDR